MGDLKDMGYESRTWKHKFGLSAKIRHSKENVLVFLVMRKMSKSDDNDNGQRLPQDWPVACLTALRPPKLRVSDPRSQDSRDLTVPKHMGLESFSMFQALF